LIMATIGFRGDEDLVQITSAVEAMLAT
jgi:hypothetical protein